MRLLLGLCVAITSALGLVAQTQAAPGDLDPTFGTSGVTLGTRTTPRALALQSDGRIVVVSTHLERYLTDGLIDSSFRASPLSTGNTLRRSRAVAIQSDDGIVVAGEVFGPLNDTSAFEGFLFDADGVQKTTFTVFFGPVVFPPGPFNPIGLATSVAVFPDDTFTFGGIGAEAFSGFSDLHLALASFSSDGSLLDQSLTAVVQEAHGLTALAAQADGKLVGVGGRDFLPTPGTETALLVRYDGVALDAGFGTGGVVAVPADMRSSDVALQSTGKIVVGGHAVGGTNAFQLARYDTSGALDPTFGTGGVVTTPIGPSSEISAIAIQPDDRIVAVGTVDDPNGPELAIAYYLPNGMLDGAFGTGGIVTTTIGTETSAMDVVLEPEGMIIALMDTDAAGFAMARYTVPPFCGDGTLDGGETCDAGAANGTTSCCTTACTIRPAGETCRPTAHDCDVTETCDGVTSACPADAPAPDGTPCDDANVCTAVDTCTAGICDGPPLVCMPCETCDPTLGCQEVPRSGCRRPTLERRARLRIFDKDPDKRDQIQWQWKKGEATTIADFADPLTSDDYTFCLYDESGASPAITLAVTVPYGGTCRGTPCWRTTSKGVKYRDRDAAGIGSIVTRAGDAGKAKITLKAKGENVPIPTLPLSLPTRVQLHAGADQCFEAVFSADQLQTNLPTKFDGRAD